ncbi:unnamed protein product [Nyctereutes procyonoides]|uniref:(raccoon dog) hypothetical protein n=1 Tax=Nyctereutes procyonoides TaxID=34880 RepID=A0A811Y3B5_NYCPR|nr:unnamed protein product [Nyctereutes procyonoides]
MRDHRLKWNLAAGLGPFLTPRRLGSWTAVSPPLSIGVRAGDKDAEASGDLRWAGAPAGAASSPREGLGDSPRGQGGPAPRSAACFPQSSSPQNKKHPVKHRKRSGKHASRQSDTIQRPPSRLLHPSGSLTQQLTQRRLQNSGSKELSAEGGREQDKGAAADGPQAFWFAVTTGLLALLAMQPHVGLSAQPEGCLSSSGCCSPYLYSLSLSL